MNTALNQKKVFSIIAVKYPQHSSTVLLNVLNKLCLNVLYLLDTSILLQTDHIWITR